jgi:tRNA (cmo5U34)-methyltransferase
LVAQDNDILTKYALEKYAQYLEQIGGKRYSKKILDFYSPRSTNYQLELMKKAGFKNIKILHKNMCFGTFCSIK